MALGDDLLGGGGGLIGPTAFTPEMKKRGIKLMSSAGTTPAGTVGGNLMPATAADEGRRQRMEGSPRAQILGPEDVRPKNSFNPAQLEIPEDDAMTPAGILAPSEIKEQGGMMSKLGDFLGNPAGQKMLAALGMQILPENTQLGEFAMGQAEANAQQMFQQNLEAGQSVGDALIPGLSPEGRETVLASRRAEGEEQRAEQRESRLQSQEERLQERAGLEMQRLEQQLEAGEIDNEIGQLQLGALKAAQENAGDPNQMFRAGAKALGMNLPEGINLEGFTPEQTFGILDKLAGLEMVRRQMSGVGKGEATSVSMLSEAARQQRVETYQTELSSLRNSLQNLPVGRSTGTGAERTEIRNQIEDRINKVLELGGDPFATPKNPTAPPGGGTGEDASVGEIEIQNIMEKAGLTRAQAESLTPDERFKILQAAQGQ